MMSLFVDFCLVWILFSTFVGVWNLLKLIELLRACVFFLLFSMVIVFQSSCVASVVQLSVRLFLPELLFMLLDHFLIVLFSGESCGPLELCF